VLAQIGILLFSRLLLILYAFRGISFDEYYEFNTLILKLIFGYFELLSFNISLIFDIEFIFDILGVQLCFRRFPINGFSGKW